MITSEWRQNWRIIPPSLAGIMLCAFHSYSLGVMIPSLEQEFGWGRAEISSGPLIISITSLFLAPLVGSAVDRLGPRRIGLFGVLFFCSALALLSMASANIMTWWGLWLLLAIASMFVIPTIWTKAINGRFVKNRGMALALILCGTGITAAIIPAVTNLLVERYGWRGAYVGLGAIGFVVVFPLIWLLFHAAPASASQPVAGGAAVPDDSALTGMSAREGFTSPAFLKLAGAAASFALAGCALTTNSVPVLIANGLTATAAAGVAGLIGIGSIVGRLCGGYLLDRLDAEKVAAVSVVLPLAAIGLLLAFPGSVGTATAACFILGLSVGTELDACAYLAARHFGLRSFGALFGAINGLLLFGAGVAPILANYIYDVTKSYNLLLWGLIPFCLAASLLFLMLGTRPEVQEPETAVAEAG